MKAAWICLLVAWGLPGDRALAQGAGEPAEKVRACLPLATAERLECLEKLSHDLAPPPAEAVAPRAADVSPDGDTWIVSETTSPVDYSPITVATASSGSGPEGAAMRLSIQCRGGRTDLVIDGPAFARQGEGYVVSYAANGDKPAVLPAGPNASGRGLLIKVDVARLLGSLPDHGYVAFLVRSAQGPAQEGRYALAALKPVVGRLATPCRWPAAVVRAPGN